MQAGGQQFRELRLRTIGGNRVWPVGVTGLKPRVIAIVLAVLFGGCWNWSAFHQDGGAPATNDGAMADAGTTACVFGRTNLGSCVFAP
jgi:hypothetical protein